MARCDGTKGQQTGQPRPFRCPARQQWPSAPPASLHHPPFIVATRQTFPFSRTPDTDLIGRRYCYAYYAPDIPMNRDRNPAFRRSRRLSSCQWSTLYVSSLEIMNICFSFFFKRKKIGYNTCSFYFFFYCVRQDFSLSVDRNIFQGERDGGKNLLGWRIVLGNDFFFFETSWMKCSKDRWDGGGPLGGSTKFLIDRGRFDTLRRVDQKVVLLEIQEINERVEKLAKRVLYKLVIKTLHNYRWNYSFTFINKNETMKNRSRSR